MAEKHKPREFADEERWQIHAALDVMLSLGGEMGQTELVGYYRDLDLRRARWARSYYGPWT